MPVVVLIALFLAAAFLILAGLMLEAARTSGLRDISWRAALAITAVRAVPGGVVLVLLCVLADPINILCVLWLGVLADSLTTIWLVREWTGGAWPPVVRASVRQGVFGCVAGVLLLFTAGQCLGACVWRNSSMSPNIRGYHTVEVQPDGTHLINAANDPHGRGLPTGASSVGVIEETFEVRPTVRPIGYTHTADRLLCNRTRRPVRWDAVVFRSPYERYFHSVRRLVALPGERVAVQDGAVWVDGQRLIPPDRVGPVQYRGPDWWPVPSQPDAGMSERLLGPDELFLLGDNPPKSPDCRDYGPVRQDQILGVVEAIYWPPVRWRLWP